MSVSMSVPGQTSNYFNYQPVFHKCTVLLCMEFELPFEMKDVARVSRFVMMSYDELQTVNWSHNELTNLLRHVCSCYTLHKSALLLGKIGMTKKINYF
jgi:hypothetical protein